MPFTTYSKDEIDALGTGTGRLRLTSDTVITVGPSGDFATPQEAIDQAYQLDIGQYKLTIGLADGTYGEMAVKGPLFGQTSWDQFTIKGLGTAQNCVIDGTNSAIDVSENARCFVDNCEVHSTNAAGVRSWYGAVVNIGPNFRFGDCYSCQAYSGSLSRVNANTGYTISGNAQRHLLLEGGRNSFVGGTLNFEGQRTFSAAFVEMGYLSVYDFQPANISGLNPIGYKFDIHGPAEIVPTAGDETALHNLPGTLPGKFSTNPTFVAAHNSVPFQVPNNTWTTVPHDVVDFDKTGWYNPTSFAFQPLRRGWWKVAGLLQANNLPANIQLLSRFLQNGVTPYGYMQNNMSIMQNILVRSEDMIYFDGSTNFITHQIYQNSGSPVTMFQGPNVSNFKALFLGDWNL